MGRGPVWHETSSLAEEASAPRGDMVTQGLFFFLFCLFRATPGAYGSSQARGESEL